MQSNKNRPDYMALDPRRINNVRTSNPAWYHHCIPYASIKVQTQEFGSRETSEETWHISRMICKYGSQAWFLQGYKVQCWLQCSSVWKNLESAGSLNICSKRYRCNSPYDCNTVRKRWKDVVSKLFERCKLIHTHIRICKNQSLHDVILLLGNAQSL